MDNQKYKTEKFNEKQDPVIDFSRYNFSEKKQIAVKPEGFNLNIFWSQFSGKNQLYIGIVLGALVVFVVFLISFSNYKSNKQQSVAPAQYAVPVNYPADSENSYKVPLP